MRQVWKADIPVDDQCHTVNLPVGCKVLHVDCQRINSVSFWFESTGAETEPRLFRVFGTGHDIPADNYHHVGTAMSGMFVWHLYEAT